MHNLPPRYIKSINKDTKIRKISGMNEIDMSNFPAEVITLEDLFLKRQNLPNEVNNYGEYDVITNIMHSDINIDDFNDEKIDSIEDLKISLYSLISNGTIINEDGKECTNKEAWGSEIYSVTANNTVVLAKPKYFTFNSSLKKPDKSVNNVMLFEDADNRSIYVFTNATKEEIELIPVDGLPDDKIISKVSSKYVDRFCACLDIGLPEDNLDLFKITRDELLSIDSKNLELTGVIAPMINSTIDDILHGEKMGSYQLLSNVS